MWEDRYRAEAGYLFGTEPAAVLAENAWLAIPGQSALCVADGEGRNAVYLARLGMNIPTFDLSQTAINRARRLANQASVTVDASVSDWGAWDWARQFDMVVAVFIQFTGPDARLQ